MRQLAIVILLISSALYAAPYTVTVESGEVLRSKAKAPVPKRAAPVVAQKAGPNDKRLILLSLKTCGGCKEVKNLILSPKMPKTWSIGTTPDNLIQIIEDRQTVANYGVEIVPAWVLIQGNEILGRVNSDPEEKWDPKRFVELGISLYNCHRQGAFKANIVPMEMMYEPVPLYQPGPPIVTVRPPALASGRYPLRGNWWTGCYHWSHMTTGFHRGKFNPTWVRSLSWPELQSLHSDDHEGKTKWQFVQR